MEKVIAPTPIAILMATYNGEKYLKEQLDSIISQTDGSWSLYIHDDGSTDKTCEILLEYTRKYSNIHVLEYESQKGAMSNFLSLLFLIHADYYMFSDQDDVWMKDKIELSISAMKKLEAQSPEAPIVICTDLHVTDHTLAITSSSYWKHAGIYPQLIKTFNQCAASSIATGCTMLFNKKALLSTQYPYEHATMHDAWVTMCTMKSNGIVYAIDKQLVLYRQHMNNSLGATDVSVSQFSLVYRVRNFKRMYRQNKTHYLMLKSLGYGSVIKYIYYKIIYKLKIHLKTTNN